MDNEVTHNKHAPEKVIKTLNAETIKKCMDKLRDYSQQRKELLDRVWVLEHDAETIREDINGMLV